SLLRSILSAIRPQMHSAFHCTLVWVSRGRKGCAISLNRCAVILATAKAGRSLASSRSRGWSAADHAEIMSTHLSTYSERNAPYWRRNLAVAVFGSFTTFFSLSMLLPFLPLFVEQLGAKDAGAIVQWSSYAYSATFVGTAIMSPIWGRVADAYGRKAMLVRAAIGMAILMSLIGTAHSPTELVVLRVLAGLIGGHGAAAIVMVGSQAPREKAGWALGVLSTGALSGNLMGPLVGGFLPDLVGIRGSFFIGGALIASAALATILFVREDFTRPE